MLKLIREMEELETVGDLLDALAEVDRETPLCDAGGEPIILCFFEDNDTGDPSIEIG